jgi:hypothetical protein
MSPETAEQDVPEYVGEHDVDKVTLDVIENTLANTRYEMDRVLETTAVSPVIREESDQFPLIADPQGRLVIGQFGQCSTATSMRRLGYRLRHRVCVVFSVRR